jgi:hypothetical protein
MEQGLLALRVVVTAGGEGATKLLSISLKRCGSAMGRGPLLLQHRLFCGHRGRLLQKQEEVAAKDVLKTVPGISYNKLSIGVPKEIWKNERRWVHWLTET